MFRRAQPRGGAQALCTPCLLCAEGRIIVSLASDRIRIKSCFPHANNYTVRTVHVHVQGLCCRHLALDSCRDKGRK